MNPRPARESSLAAQPARYAEVALLPARPGLDLLTYGVPEAERDRIQAGMRVLVPLGRRRETGLVVALSHRPPAGIATIRDVAELLDAEPILTEEIFALSRWTARYYLTTLADVLATALPGGLRATSTRVVRLADAGNGAADRPLETAILGHLRAAGAATLPQLAQALGRPHVSRAVRALAARGAVLVEDRVRSPAGRTRWIRMLRLVRELDTEEQAALARRAPRQHALYQRLVGAPDRRLAADALTVGERAAADALVRRGVAGRFREERYREVRPPAAAVVAALAPTGAQRAAIEAVASTSGFQVFVLHGVTGSGKTEVYLQLAARSYGAGRSVLMLVPEIALTHQLVLRAQERFGPAVALLHSGLGPGERWDEWRRVTRGEARIVIGTRSAVFAPLRDLGLVIVDEEHDAAYKQEEGLRYQARDLAVVRAKLAGVSVILGSATPSLESYQQALDGRFRLLELAERVEGRTLPAVEIVDLRAVRAPASLRAGDTHDAAGGAAAPPSADSSLPTQAETRLFSQQLLDAVQATLARGEQVLLFLNRRGFAASLQCLTCGEPAGCPSCSVTLTLHRGRGALLCHHCGYARLASSACASCGSPELRAVGEGTERVESEARRLFPQARIARLDRDTTGRKGSHRRILDAWRAGETDVLVGTQMVTKGHDIPGVTLVGVLLADVALNMPDFRAAERAFQLLAQVAGRAGRGDAPGRVLIQTYRPQHHALLAATGHDYARFAPRELALRRELGYPPFGRLAILRLDADADADAERAAADLAARARAAAEGEVTVRGPAPAPLERLRGRYRWQVLVASPRVHPLHVLLQRLQSFWASAPGTRAVRLVIDVDPVSML